MGVFVNVAVAVGRGVMLANGVVVITTVSVGAGRVAITVTLGAEVRNWASAVAVMLIDGRLGAGTVADGAVKHPDAASNTTIAINKSGTFTLFIIRPSNSLNTLHRVAMISAQQ
jgi:hypothetical protein